MSLWAAVFDGVAGKAEFTGITFSDNTDIEMKVKFTSLQTGGLLSDGLAGRYFRYGAGSFRFRSSSTTYPTWVYTPVVDQFYDIMVECRSGGVELFIDGVSQGIKSGAFGTFNIDTIALFNGNLFADVVIERLKITDNTTASNSIDLFNEAVAGSSVDWPDVSANNKTITLVDTATDGSQWELIGGGGGVTVAVTETLNPFVDSSVINIDYNVSAIVTEVFQPFSDISSIEITPKASITATVTETLNPFSDNSTVAIVDAGNIAVNVTETLSAFKDSSIIDVSANVGVLVTEVLNSFLDGSNVTIAKDIEVTVTEVLSAFSDNSSVRMPTNWVDKQVSVTSYTTQTPVNTIWTDKG